MFGPCVKAEENVGPASWPIWSSGVARFRKLCNCPCVFRGLGYVCGNQRCFPKSECLVLLSKRVPGPIIYIKDSVKALGLFDPPLCS